MNLSCKVTDLGHRYQHNYLFRNLNFEATAGKLLVIKGNNGAGKSTLLKIMSGAMEPVEGSVQYLEGEMPQNPDNLWKKIGLVAPYQELPEELSLLELIDFQIKMIPMADPKPSYAQRSALFGMEGEASRPLGEYSTGMKQKAKLILSLTKGRNIWLLDEPTSNLDPASHQLFWDWIAEHKQNRLIVVATNDSAEMGQADDLLDLNASGSH